MLINITKLSVVFASVLLLSGFSIEPASDEIAQERRLQESLPMSNDTMWDSFAACKVNLDKEEYTYSINYTPEIKAIEGTKIEISGFVLPLESTEKFTHFLISKRTPTCFYCPPGEPNEIAEVFSKTPIKWEENIIKVSGTLQFTKNPELGLFFQIKDADIVDK